MTAPVEFDAIYYDGKTSARAPVRVRQAGSGLHVHGPELNFEIPLAGITADAPLAGVPRSLLLPGGEQLKTEDHAAVDALFPESDRIQRAAHFLEGRWSYALGGLVTVGLFLAGFILFVLPVAATFVAGMVPKGAEESVGEQAFASIERSFCTPSKLPAARQRSARAAFDLLTAKLDDGYRYRLEVRECQPLGANAFALPGGIIVVTDALVRRAQNVEQVAAVLAHEAGHVRHRHGLRRALQAAGVAVLVSSVLGDAMTITNLAALLPAALLERGYSREFEDEADRYAFERLKQVGISPARFAEMMALLDRKSGRGAGMRDYLATHPPTQERIERARAAAH